MSKLVRQSLNGHDNEETVKLRAVKEIKTVLGKGNSKITRKANDYSRSI